MMQKIKDLVKSRRFRYSQYNKSGRLIPIAFIFGVKKCKVMFSYFLLLGVPLVGR